MNNWMAEAARLTRQRAPLVTDAHANEIAKDLYKAWADNTPATAVSKFFHVMPANWKTEPRDALATH